jgi:hypothetical protein
MQVAMIECVRKVTSATRGWFNNVVNATTRLDDFLQAKGDRNIDVLTVTTSDIEINYCRSFFEADTLF